MIGTHMNGGVILMVLPADDDYFVVLHVRFSNRGNEYATGLVHVRQLPAPREWWSGHYFNDDREAAVLDAIKRSALDWTNDIRLNRIVQLAAATERKFAPAMSE